MISSIIDRNKLKKITFFTKRNMRRILHIYFKRRKIMHRFFSVILILTLYANQAISETDIDSFAVRVNQLFQHYHNDTTPGVAVLVQHKGEILYLRCFGSANLEHNIPITPQTSFDLASVSKHITAFAILMLERQGKLDINENIRSYLNELPQFADSIRIKDLIYQSSGLWEFWTILNKYSGFRNRDYFNMNDVLTLIQYQEELLFPPGTRYAYTNTNYSLLAEIVKRITGQSFEKWTRENIFNPLGMFETFFQENCSLPISQKASAYRKRNGKIVLARPANVEIPGSAHAFTTLNDMAVWLNNFRTKKVGGPEIFQKMITKGRLRNGEEIDYGAGCIVSEFMGDTIIQHSGQSGGYKAMMIYHPKETLGVVILANERSIDVYDLAHEILEIFFKTDKKQELAATQPKRSQFINLPRSKLNIYCGGYQIENSGDLLGVYINYDLLVGSILGLGSEYFYPLTENTFSDYGRNTFIRFIFAEDSTVVGASVVLRGDTLYAAKIRPTLAWQKTENNISGFYYCISLGSCCRIEKRNNETILSHRRYSDIQLFELTLNQFVGQWGFIEFTQDTGGLVDGFVLKDELFGFKEIRFIKISN